MDIMVVLFVVWGLVTILFLGLVFYRSRMSRKESDWIPLSDDAREDKAIEAQKATETEVHKLDFPIRALGAAWVVVALVIVGYWFYHGLMTQPPVPK